MIIDKVNAISCLGNWEVSIWGDDLSTIKYHSSGEDISKPADFPSDADINARQVDMQTKANTGNYTTIQAINATY